ncbi:BON domain-containing protein [Allocoleopsis sp.]|uniref:BON domain-containing protein n=1 Tax=Allocoleopsis sp. TaxID=3088169 RepID=UPI002FD66C7F
MVSFADDPTVASGRENGQSKSTEMSPQDYKQIESFFGQLAQLLNVDAGGQTASSDREVKTEDVAPFTASPNSGFVQFPQQTVSVPASPPPAPEADSVVSTQPAPLKQTEPEAATTVEELIALIEPDYSDPETATALEGLLALIEPDRTEPKTAAALEELIVLPSDQLPPVTVANSTADELESSPFQQRFTPLNQQSIQLEEQWDTSNQPTSRRNTAAKAQKKESTNRLSLVPLGVGLAILIGVPWGIYQYFKINEHRLEQKLAQALAAAPELAVYRLGADVRGKTVHLTGKLPSRDLRRHAEQLTHSVVPGFRLANDIIVVDELRDRSQVVTEVQRVAMALNQIDGISISTDFADGKVTLKGTAIQLTNPENIIQAFKQIPGVQSVINQVKIQPFSIATRIYFNSNSVSVEPRDIDVKLAPIKQLLRQYPSLQLQIVGYSHPTDRAGTQMALMRSQAVQTILEDIGVDRRRLRAISRKGSPTNVSPDQEHWLSRCVLFEIIQPNPKAPQGATH